MGDSRHPPLHVRWSTNLGVATVKLFRTTTGIFVEEDNLYYRIDGHSWNDLLAADDLPERLAREISGEKAIQPFNSGELLPPIDAQEVWAAGVTYYRSRGARMEESKDAGGGDFYDRVYSAERPEVTLAGPSQSPNSLSSSVAEAASPATPSATT
jgi:hypothetical protein